MSELLANPFVRVLFTDVVGGAGVRAGIAVTVVCLAWVAFVG